MRRRARVEHEARARQVAEQRAEVVYLGIDARADGPGHGEVDLRMAHRKRKAEPPPGSSCEGLAAIGAAILLMAMYKRRKTPGGSVRVDA